MKKIILITAFALGTYMVFAQAPEKMSYQAVVRNATGQLVQNQNIGIKASVLQNSATGTVVYSERLTGTTNVNGLVSLAIGSGIVLSGTFASIDWSTGNYYLKTETDPSGGTNYSIVGTSQLLSVPYAMYAKSSGSGGTSQWTTNGNNISNGNSGNVGIGIPTPAAKLDILGTSNNMVLKAEGASQNGTIQGNNTTTGSTNFTSTGVEGIAASGIGTRGKSIDGYGVDGYSTNNRAGNFLINNPNNNSSALKSSTVAKGVAIEGEAYHTDGIAGLFVNLNANPGLALKTVGKVQLTGISEGAGKVLTSDATGNASWQDAKGVQFRITGLKSDILANNSNGINIINVWDGSMIGSIPTYYTSYNVGGGTYDAANGTYTIPVPGYYEVNAKISFSSLPQNADSRIGIQIMMNNNTIDDSFATVRTGSAMILNTITTNATVYLKQGDKVSIRVFSDKVNTIQKIFNTTNSFSVLLLQ